MNGIWKNETHTGAIFEYTTQQSNFQKALTVTELACLISTGVLKKNNPNKKT